MTEMPIEHAAHAALAPPLPSRRPTLHDLAVAGDVIARMAPVLRGAASPPAEEAVELLVAAARFGASARDLAPIVCLLRDLVGRLQDASGPQPAFTPAHPEDADGGM